MFIIFLTNLVKTGCTFNCVYDSVMQTENNESEFSASDEMLIFVRIDQLDVKIKNYKNLFNASFLILNETMIKSMSGFQENKIVKYHL